jgi:hypothetical protein
MNRLLLLLSAFVLTGCFEVSEDLTIHGDGSGRIVFEIGLDENIAKLAALGNDSGTFFDRNKLEERLKTSENVEKYEIRERMENGVQRTIVDVMVKDMTEDMDGLGDLASKDVAEKLDVGDKSAAPFVFTRMEGGNFKFTQNVTKEKKEDTNALVAGLMSSQLSGKYMRVKLNGAIVSANGSIAEDKKSVSWEIPMAQIVNGTAMVKTLEAEIEGVNPKGAVMSLLLFCILFGVILIGLIVLRNRLKS